MSGFPIGFVLGGVRVDWDSGREEWSVWVWRDRI